MTFKLVFVSDFSIHLHTKGKERKRKTFLWFHLNSHSMLAHWNNNTKFSLKIGHLEFFVLFCVVVFSSNEAYTITDTYKPDQNVSWSIHWWDTNGHESNIANTWHTHTQHSSHLNIYYTYAYLEGRTWMLFIRYSAFTDTQKYTHTHMHTTHQHWLFPNIFNTMQVECYKSN